MFGLGKSLQGVFSPVLAGVVTTLLIWVTVRLPDELDPVDNSVGWLIPLMLILPFFVSALWGWALLAGKPRKLVLILAGALLAVALVRLPQEIIWPVAGNVVAGLAAGLALGSRWRIDAGLLAVTLCLAPVLIWSAVQMPVIESMNAIRDTTLESMEDNLWSNLEAEQLSQVRLQEQARIDQAIGVIVKVFPAMLAVEFWRSPE